MPEFREATLANGLRIAAESDTRGYSAAFGYFIRAGARDEKDQEAGLSLEVDWTVTLAPALVDQAKVRFGPDSVTLRGTGVGGTTEPEKVMGLEKLLVWTCPR